MGESRSEKVKLDMGDVRWKTRDQRIRWEKELERRGVEKEMEYFFFNLI